MRPIVVVEVKIPPQTFFRVPYAGIIFQIDVLVLDRPPEPFHEDVVECPAATIHADLDAMVFEDSGKCIARELHSLIAVEYLRPVSL